MSTNGSTRFQPHAWPDSVTHRRSPRTRTRVLVASGTFMALSVAVAVVGPGRSNVASDAPAPARPPVVPTALAPPPTAPPATTSPTTGARTTVRAIVPPGVVPSRVAPVTATTLPKSSTSDSSGSLSYASTAPTPPAQDIPPNPNISFACPTAHDQDTCIATALLAFDNARAEEGVGPMVLPTDFASLTPSEQLFVVVDSERVDRGLTPIAGELTSLDQPAATAAQDEEDPSVPSGGIAGLVVSDWVSNWASTDSDLSAVYGWMYDDGLGSDNIDCTVADESGCWDHRDNILGFQNDVDRFGGSLSFGGATFTTGTLHGRPVVSVTTLTTWSPTATSGYYYSWDQAVADGAG